MMTTEDPRRGKVVLIHGPSGSGKSSFLEAIQSLRGMNCRLLTKYTTREARLGDQLVEIRSAPQLPESHDIRYSMYGNEYGLSSEEIEKALASDGLSVAVVSDLKTLEGLKARFHSNAIVVYLQRDLGDEEVAQSLARNGLEGTSIDERVAHWREFEALLNLLWVAGRPSAAGASRGWSAAVRDLGGGLWWR